MALFCCLHVTVSAHKARMVMWSGDITDKA